MGTCELTPSKLAPEVLLLALPLASPSSPPTPERRWPKPPGVAYTPRLRSSRRDAPPRIQPCRARACNTKSCAPHLARASLQGPRAGLPARAWCGLRRRSPRAPRSMRAAGACVSGFVRGAGRSRETVSEIYLRSCSRGTRPHRTCTAAPRVPQELPVFSLRCPQRAQRV